MKNYFLFLICFLLFSISAQAQTKIRGTFADSLTKEPLPFSTVYVAPVEEASNFLYTGITDEKGSFSGSVNKNGDMVITLGCVGKVTIKMKFTVSGQHLYDFGTIYTSDKSDTLDVVEVIARKPLISQEAGKTKYNTEADPENKTSTVLDMLRKMPGINVDGSDNISLNGKSNFLVYVNNKKNTLLSNRPGPSLKMMPASSVKSIEIISEPGAKYDAEGVGGIINLITDKKKNADQYAASLEANHDNQQEVGSYGGTFSVQKGKFSSSLNAFYSDYKSVARINNCYSGYNNQDTTNQFENGELDFNGYYYSIGLSSSYEIDSLNLISLSAGYSKWSEKHDGLLDLYLSDGNVATTFDGLVNSRQNSHSDVFNISIDYQNISKRNPLRILTLSYKYDVDPYTSVNRSYNLSGNYSCPLRDLSDRYTDSDNYSGEHTFQADYSSPLSKLLSVDAGLKCILRPNESENIYKSGTFSNLVYDSLSSMHFKYNDRIVAGYTEFSFNSGAISSRAGVRYEYTFQDAEYIYGQGADFDKDYGTFVPSALIQYKFTQSQNVSINYNMRIGRPDIYKLNPYVDRTDPAEITYGNPELECEKYHSITLSYGYFSNVNMVNLSFGYSGCNNGISDAGVLNENIIEKTYNNSTQNNSAYSSLYYNLNIGKSTRFMISGSVHYNELKNTAQNLYSDGWTGNVYAMLSRNFKYDINAMLSCYISSKSVGLQLSNDAFHIGMLNVSKSFWKKQFTVSLRAMCDLKNFDKLNYTSKYSGTNFNSSSTFSRDFLQVTLGLSWNFGGKIDVKKTSKTITNTDLLSSGKGNQSLSTPAGN